MVLSIYVYGFLKKKFNKEAKMSEDTVIKVDYIQEETLGSLLHRLEIVDDELGECFINSKVATEETKIPDNARVAIFCKGMNLLCGGQHLKGHGNISEKPIKKTNYFY